MNKLEVGKDYINKDSLIVIDRIGDTTNRGIDGNNFEYDLFCSCPYVWREATEEEVIEAFKKHLVHRYGEDWKTMKIKERHPDSLLEINDGSGEVEICKCYDGWNVWNKNGMLYFNGIWVERLEEEPKIHIKEAIKENTVIHCETEEEANRILEQKPIWSDYYLNKYRWYRKCRKQTWYKHQFTNDALELSITFTGTWWALYGKINRYSDVIDTEVW